MGFAKGLRGVMWDLFLVSVLVSFVCESTWSTQTHMIPWVIYGLYESMFRLYQLRVGQSRWVVEWGGKGRSGQVVVQQGSCIKPPRCPWGPLTLIAQASTGLQASQQSASLY